MSLAYLIFFRNKSNKLWEFMCYHKNILKVYSVHTPKFKFCQVNFFQLYGEGKTHIYLLPYSIDSSLRMTQRTHANRQMLEGQQRRRRTRDRQTMEWASSSTTKSQVFLKLLFFYFLCSETVFFCLPVNGCGKLLLL